MYKTTNPHHSHSLYTIETSIITWKNNFKLSAKGCERRPGFVGERRSDLRRENWEERRLERERGSLRCFVRRLNSFVLGLGNNRKYKKKKKKLKTQLTWLVRLLWVDSSASLKWGVSLLLFNLGVSLEAVPLRLASRLVRDACFLKHWLLLVTAKSKPFYNLNGILFVFLIL